jgi:hypothetical protein
LICVNPTSACKPACGVHFKIVEQLSNEESSCEQEFDKRSPSGYTTANSSIAAKEKT